MEQSESKKADSFFARNPSLFLAAMLAALIVIINIAGWYFSGPGQALSVNLGDAVRMENAWHFKLDEIERLGPSSVVEREVLEEVVHNQNGCLAEPGGTLIVRERQWTSLILSYRAPSDAWANSSACPDQSILRMSGEVYGYHKARMEQADAEARELNESRKRFQKKFAE